MSKTKLICDRCGISNEDPIYSRNHFYQNAEVIICDRCKNDNIWDNLSPVIWMGNLSKRSGEDK